MSSPYINYYAYVKPGNTWESMSVSTRSFGLSRRMVLYTVSQTVVRAGPQAVSEEKLCKNCIRH